MVIESCYMALSHNGDFNSRAEISFSDVVPVQCVQAQQAMAPIEALQVPETKLGH